MTRLHNLTHLNFFAIAVIFIGVVVGVELLALIWFKVLGFFAGIKKWR